MGAGFNLASTIRVSLAGAVLLLFLPSANGAEVKWPPGEYKYIVIDQDVRDALVELGRNLNVPVSLSDQVKGRVRGRLPTGTAEQFLTRLCESYGLVWYFDGAMLHVNAMTELKTELIEVGRDKAAEMVHKLGAKEFGIADARYPIKGSEDTGIVSVSGPPPYISLVRETLTAMARSAGPTRAREGGLEEVRVRVFRGG